MAFLGQDGWKADLSPAQRAKVEELEKKLEAAIRDRSQKQHLLENLEQISEGQTRRAEQDRSRCVDLLKEVRQLEERCQDLQNARDQLQRDREVKEAQCTSLKVNQIQ